jgi:hypothetical protein
LSVSEDKTSNEPGETSTSEWASSAGGELGNSLILQDTSEYLEDTDNNTDNVDDESPVEPGMELSGDIFVASSID